MSHVTHIRPRRLVPVVLALVLAGACPAAARTLHRGDRGADVRALNGRLAGLGYLPGGSARSAAFGDATYHGVVAAQKWERLARDGIVGPQTRGALAHARRPRPSYGGHGRRVEIHFDRQVVLLMVDGRVRRAIAVSTGKPGYRTPAGEFRVYAKARHSYSYEYGVWLPYASYFIRGVALHGYAEVPTSPASHGCVRVPLAFAPEVYRFVRVGTPVRVLYPGASARAALAMRAGSTRPLGP